MTEPSHIVRNLWLGTYIDGQDQEFLKTNNISLVLCLCDIALEEVKSIQYVSIPVNDCACPNQKETEHFMDVILRCMSIIQKQIDSDLSVLVVCGAGRQRSAAVVASYIARFVLKNADGAERLEDAITHTMIKRSVAFRVLDKGIVTQKVNWFDAMRLAVEG